MIVLRTPSVVLRHQRYEKLIFHQTKVPKGQHSTAKAAVAASDSVQLNQLRSLLSQEMAVAAPVDMNNVNRIKSAIKEGKYPIDIDKISDALMDAYRELKS